MDSGDNAGCCEGDTACQEADPDADVDAGDVELLHAGGVIGEGDTEVVEVEPVDGAILVFAEIDGPAGVAVGRAEGVQKDTGAVGTKQERVGAVSWLGSDRCLGECRNSDKDGQGEENGLFHVFKFKGQTGTWIKSKGREDEDLIKTN